MTVPTPPAVSEAMREAVAPVTRAEVRDCIGPSIPLRRRWVDLLMQGPIARLQAEIARLTGERDAAVAKMKVFAEAYVVVAETAETEDARAHAAEAETARLRAALEEIAKGAPVTEPHPWDGELDTVCWNIAQIARAALTEPPDA